MRCLLGSSRLLEVLVPEFLVFLGGGGVGVKLWERIMYAES